MIRSTVYKLLSRFQSGSGSGSGSDESGSEETGSSSGKKREKKRKKKTSALEFTIKERHETSISLTRANP